jgi:hypothetical protein
LASNCCFSASMFLALGKYATIFLKTWALLIRVLINDSLVPVCMKVPSLIKEF